MIEPSRPKDKIKQCRVLLKRLNILTKHRIRNEDKVRKKCRVDLNKSEFRTNFKHSQEQQILFLLNKLENESTARDSLLVQRKGKLSKTRNSPTTGLKEANFAPETPQAEFLENFYLKPSLRIPERESSSILSEECKIRLSPLKDIGNQPSTKNLQQKANVNVKKCSIDLIKMVGVRSSVVLTDLFECSLCPRTFVKQGHLKRHVRRIHRDSVNEEDRSPSELICQICDIPFSNKTNLRRHEDAHQTGVLSSSKVLSRCSDCQKQFQSQASLKRHILTEHRGFKNVCPWCGLNVARLDNHVAAVHHNNLSPCPVCSLMIAPAHLTRHIKAVHLGYRQRCVLCDKFFSNLHKHVKNLHGADHTDRQIFLGPYWGPASS